MKHIWIKNLGHQRFVWSPESFIHRYFLASATRRDLASPKALAVDGPPLSGLASS